MIYTLVVILSVALVYSLGHIWSMRRAAHRLVEAVQRRQSPLRSNGPGRQPAGWVEVTSAVDGLIDENGALRQQRSDQLAQLEATLGHLREAVLIVDESNYIHLANRALREIFPSARNLANLRLELVVRSADFHEYVQATREGRSPPRQEFEIEEGVADKLWIEASGAQIPSPDGLSRWALFVLHDITRQKKLEALRKDFVANASHELRTPLSIIKGYVETLADGHASMAVEDREKFLRTIQRHAERMNALIEDLLQLSRLESATPGLRLQPIRLPELVQAVVDDYRHRPNAGGHTLEVDLDPSAGPLTADPARLTQIFNNLLDNALKYTPRGSRVCITARAARAGEIEIAVRDNGPGIPAVDLPHLFERFYRVDKGRSRESGGTGLGLSIVKHIVQLHNGRVWVESEQGRGVAIRFTLPLQPPSSGSDGPGG